MTFQQAEQQFRQLEAAFVAGQIDMAYYKAALSRLQVVDSAGVIWQIQERSGRWYCYWQGQWVARSPYPNAQAPAAANPAPQIPAQGQYYPVPQAPAQRRPASTSRTPLLIGLIMGVLVVGAGLIFLFTNVLNKQGGSASQPGSPAAASTTPPVAASVLTLQKTGETSVTANGSPVTDANGVMVQVPAKALAADSPKAQVTTHKMQGPLADALSSGFTINSPLYTLEASGQQDSTGRGTLVFPAPSQQSRLLEIIDDRYTVMVETQPVDGKLTFHARLGPSGTQTLEKAGSLRYDGSRRFVVVTPKVNTKSDILPVSAQFQAAGGSDCTVYNRVGISPCRANEDRTIRVNYSSNLNITAQQAYQVAKEAEKWMKKYKDLGFTNADLSSYWFAMEIVIEAGSGDPSYSSRSGIIYMPLDFAKKVSTGESSRALAHELGHWIEDEAYRMAWAGLKSYALSADFWWMEVAAENMVFLADSTAIKSNIQTYGTITGANESLVWQLSPWQWPADYYAHAQLVKVFMCESTTCLTSEKTFKEAINKGSFPFASGTADPKLIAGLEDYARYLIGAAPKKLNTAISLDGVADSETFGEVINVTQKAGGTGGQLFFIGNRKPQVTKVVADKVKNGMDYLEFTAPLEKYGVYPLTIVSKKGYAGLPTQLVVEAGMPVVYRLDKGEVKTHSGDKELILGPISSEMGFSEVRVAAYSTATGMTFKARLELVDLKGAWAVRVASGDPTASTVTCDNPPKDGKDELYKAFPIYGGIAMAFGDFAPAGDPTKLEWSMLSKRVPSDVKPGEFSEDYQVEITPKAIKIKGNFDVPKTQSNQPGAGQVAGLTGLAFGAVGLVGVVGVKRWTFKQRHWLIRAGVLVLLVILLTGCVDFYGTSTVEITITKFESGGGTTDATWTINSEILPPQKPIWSITEVTGVYTIKSTSETGGLTAKDPVTYNHCNGTLTYKLTGGIYPDITIINNKTK